MSLSKTQDKSGIRVTSADMDVYFCCSGERPRKGSERFAKGLNTPIRLDVQYLCLAVTVAFIQPLNKNFGSFSQIGMGFSIGTETHAHPLMKHEF